MMMVRLCKLWMCWYQALVRWLVVQQGKIGWMCWIKESKNASSIWMLTGGTVTYENMDLFLMLASD